MMQHATLEDNDDLQTRWAALIANAALPGGVTVSPSHPEILKQLSPQEAKFLDVLYDQLLQVFDQSYGGELDGSGVTEIALGSADFLMDIYAGAGLTRTPAKLLTTLNPEGNDRDKANDRYEFHVVKNNLMRHQLIEIRTVTGASGYGGTPAEYRADLYLTPLAFQFTRACRAPEPPNGEPPTT